jgi:hypothetical protein
MAAVSKCSAGVSMMSVDCGDQLVLKVTIGTVACCQLLQTWPRCDVTKCFQGRMESTLNCITDKQEPDCTVSYARDENLNVFHLCHVSCQTVSAQQFGDNSSLTCAVYSVFFLPLPFPALSEVPKLILVNFCLAFEM